MEIITKSAWGSRTTNVATLSGALAKVYIHHTAGYYPKTVKEEYQQMITLQHIGIDIDGNSDMPYNWVIGPSGLIYEARGLNKKSAATRDQNEISRSVCLMGNFQTQIVTPLALKAISEIICKLIDLDNLVEARQLEILGHKDNPLHPLATACPGINLYNLIPMVRSTVINHVKPQGDSMLQPRFLRQKGYLNVFIAGGGYPLMSISGELMDAIKAEELAIPHLLFDNMPAFTGMCNIAGLDIKDPKQIVPGGPTDRF